MTALKGDRGLARKAYEYASRVYQEAEERYLHHRERCDAFQCEICSRLNRAAEDAWDAVVVSQYLAF